MSNLCGFSISGSVHIRRTSSVCLPAGSRPVGYRQDIFAQEMGSSIVCTFVQTVQLRGCTGTSVWFSKVKLHCTRYCYTNVPLHMTQRYVSRKKRRSRLKGMIDLEWVCVDCWNRTNNIFTNFYVYECRKFRTHANSNMESLTWLIPWKLLLGEPNWKYRSVATHIAS